MIPVAPNPRFTSGAVRFAIMAPKMFPFVIETGQEF